MLLALGLFVCLSTTPQSSFGEVFIPSHEYISYFDSNGIYTVVGNVKNQNDFALIPTITISVIDTDDKKLQNNLFMCQFLQ